MMVLKRLLIWVLVTLLASIIGNALFRDDTIFNSLQYFIDFYIVCLAFITMINPFCWGAWLIALLLALVNRKKNKLTLRIATYVFWGFGILSNLYLFDKVMHLH